jgi:hypothetical protein
MAKGTELLTNQRKRNVLGVTHRDRIHSTPKIQNFCLEVGAQDIENLLKRFVLRKLDVLLPRKELVEEKKQRPSIIFTF